MSKMNASKDSSALLWLSLVCSVS